MYEAIGIISKKTYATGTKADCFRELHERFPTLEEKDHNKKGAQSTLRVIYPEAIIIRKK